MKKVFILFSITVLILLFLLNNKQKQVKFNPPTEIAKNHDEEKSSHKRKKWLKEIHKTAPGTDWKKIETKQWNKQVLKRSKFLKSSKKTNNWTEQGSVDVAGRTHHAVLSGDGEHIYIGTNGGGVWKGKFDPSIMVPENMDWTPLGDNVMGGAMQIAILHKETDVIVKSWDNTIHYSTDQGQTWNISNGIEMSSYQAIRRFITFPEDSDTVMATMSGWELISGNWVYKNYIFKSTDAGVNFTKIKDLGNSGGDIWTSRTESGPLYLFNNKTMYISNNKGETFEIVGAFNDTTETDTIMTGSEAGAPTFYVARKQNDIWKLYKSEDGGVSFTYKNTITVSYFGMNSYFRALSASILNPDLVLYGGVETYKSVNGGNTFTKINTWQSYYNDIANKLHADVPGIDVILLPGGGERWYISTDGGTYVSEDGCATVHNITLQGLRNSQYYSTLTDKNDENYVEAGAQDQGYQYSSNALSGNASFEQIYSGDYGQLTSSDKTLAQVYAVYPGMILCTKKTNENVSVYATEDFPSDVNYAQWLPMIVADPDDSNSVYFCGSKIIKYNPGHILWTRTDLPFDFSDSEFGDGSDYVSCLGISPANHNYWYVGTANGKFYYSTDKGINWTEGSAIEPTPHYLYSLAVLCDEFDPEVVTIAGSGYDNAAVWRSTDGGKTFNELGSNQPQCIVLDIADSPKKNGDIYAATTIGPFKYSAQNGMWSSILENNAPMTEYWSVETLSDRVRFGSYGRGIWDYKPSATVEMNNQYVIPHIDWSTQWKSRLIADNLNNENTSIRVVLYKNSNVVSDELISIEALEALPIDLDSGSCGIIYSPDNIVFREAFIHNLEDGIAEFSLNNAPSENDKTLHFLMPSYLADDLTWMGIAIFNPNETETYLTLTAYNELGEVKGTVNFSINSFERSVGLIQTYFPELDLTDVARIKAESSKPISGINISGKNNEQLLFTKAVNENNLDSSLNISHIANEWDFWNNKLIFDNLSSTVEGQLTVTLYKEGGTVAEEFPITVSTNSSLVVNLNEKNTSAPTCGLITLTSGTVAVRQSFQSITDKGTAEFVLNGNKNNNLNFIFPSYSAEILDWFGMGLFNPTDSVQEVTITGYSNSVSIGNSTITIGGKERKAFLVSDYFETTSAIDRVSVSTTSDLTGINISGSSHKRLLFTHAIVNE